MVQIGWLNTTKTTTASMPQARMKPLMTPFQHNWRIKGLYLLRQPENIDLTKTSRGVA